MATKGYQTYRGRMPRWKKALIAVLILILLGAGAFLALQKYQVFDADGIHLRLPGGENEPAPESAQPLPEMCIRDSICIHKKIWMGTFATS